VNSVQAIPSESQLWKDEEVEASRTPPGYQPQRGKNKKNQESRKENKMLEN
jgi:hypothetical protein